MFTDFSADFGPKCQYMGSDYELGSRVCIGGYYNVCTQVGSSAEWVPTPDPCDALATAKSSTSRKGKSKVAAKRSMKHKSKSVAPKNAKIKKAAKGTTAKKTSKRAPQSRRGAAKK